MRARVPRLSTRVVLCDDGEGLAQRAADVMERAGYSNLFVFDAPVHTSEAAGFQVFQGHYVTTYALGLHIASLTGTPQISAASLKEKIEAGDDVVVFDTRTFEEYHDGCVPGAHSAPMAELLYRIKDLVPDPNTEVVVNCGAVARGVLGAQALIEAQLENPIKVLTNGARGWSMADLALEHGATRSYRPVSEHSRQWSAEAAKHLRVCANVQYITREELEQWRSQGDERTLYLVDVRSAQEYEQGRIEGAIWIPGGELVGLYEDHVATMNARFCLVDDNGARATLAASWLTRMGWPDVAVLLGGVDQYKLKRGFPEDRVPELDVIDAPTITPSDLRARISKNQVLVIDVDASTAYQTGHIPGAWWCCRSKLPVRLANLPPASAYVLTSNDGKVAKLATGDLLALTETPVMTLSGGTGAWKGQGYETVAGLTRTLGDIEDVHPGFGTRPGDDPATISAAQQRMADWQDGLMGKLSEDRTFKFPDSKTHD